MLDVCGAVYQLGLLLWQLTLFVFGHFCIFWIGCLHHCHELRHPAMGQCHCIRLGHCSSRSRCHGTGRFAFARHLLCGAHIWHGRTHSTRHQLLRKICAWHRGPRADYSARDEHHLSHRIAAGCDHCGTFYFSTSHAIWLGLARHWRR